jgi:plasmid maintenance system killer protein
MGNLMSKKKPTKLIFLHKDGHLKVYEVSKVNQNKRFEKLLRDPDSAVFAHSKTKKNDQMLEMLPKMRIRSNSHNEKTPSFVATPSFNANPEEFEALRARLHMLLDKKLEKSMNTIKSRDMAMLEADLNASSVTVNDVMTIIEQQQEH